MPQQGNDWPEVHPWALADSTRTLQGDLEPNTNTSVSSGTQVS